MSKTMILYVILYYTSFPLRFFASHRNTIKMENMFVLFFYIFNVF